MTTLLEAKAVISAEDRTGAAFAAIQRKIEGLSKAASAVTSATTRATRASQQAAGAASAVAAAQSGKVGLGAASAATAGFAARHLAGIAGTIAAAEGVHKTIHASSERVHERVRMGASGMNAGEIVEAEKHASSLAAKYPAIGQTTIMHMLRNARSIVGSYEEAAHIMEPLAKLRVVAQGARPGADVSEDFDQLVKGLEIKGVTQNPKQFREYMEGIAKGLNVFGDTLKPYQYYEMFKYGRQATPMLSEKFMLGTAPTLAQELGGSSYGKAVSAFNAAIVSNIMKHSALKDFAKLGLIAPGDLDYTKAREAKGLKSGRHVQGWQLAQSDPNEWVKQYLIPALNKAGVTDKAEIIQRIGALFQNQMAAQLVQILATQQTRIDKDLALLAGARGLDAAEYFQSKDPKIIWQGFKNATESMVGTLGSGVAESLSGPVRDLAHAIAGYTERLAAADRHRKEHPDGPSLGQRKANTMLNAAFGVAGDDRSRGEAEEAARRRAQNAYGQMYQLRVDSLHGKLDRYDRLKAQLDQAQSAYDESGAIPNLRARDHARRSAANDIERLRPQVESLRADLASIKELVDAHEATQQASAALARGRAPLLMGQGVSILSGKGWRLKGRLGVTGDVDPAIGANSGEHGLPMFARGAHVSGGLPTLAAQPKPMDLAGMLSGRITAQAEVIGHLDPATVTVVIQPGSELLSVVEGAKKVTMRGSLTQGGRAPTGVSMPDALPAGAPGKSE